MGSPSQKHVLNIHPIMNLVFPARAIRTVVGSMCGSRGPNIPWGLIATVLRASELAVRTACNTCTKTFQAVFISHI